MNNFIPILRADRLREINEYKSREYIFRAGETSYNHVRNFHVANYKRNDDPDEDRIRYDFEVRTNHEEPRFYITKHKEVCVYLTIYEIYELLLEIVNELSKELVTEILTRDRDALWYINYTELEFELKYFNGVIPNDEINIPDTNINITYENLFILVALIQEKSNYYWGNSTAENEQLYTNGILRLLICLINTNGNPVLKAHNWKYSDHEKKYTLISGSNKYKYYLTQKEYENIMEV